MYGLLNVGHDTNRGESARNPNRRFRYRRNLD